MATLLSLATLVCFSEAGFAAPVWRMDSAANTTAAPGGQVRYFVQVSDVGDQPAPITPGGDETNCDAGAPPANAAKCYTIRAEFPTGLTPVSAGATSPFPGVPGLACTVAASSITCSVSGSSSDQQVPERGPTQYFRQITFTASVDPTASGVLTSSFEVAGGEAVNTDRTVDPTHITPTLPDFGLDAFDAEVTADAAGDALTQAGGHPFGATTSVSFNTVKHPNPGIDDLWPVAPTKDVVVDLPPGFVGNPTVADTCTVPELASGGIEAKPLCPPTSQVGTVLVQTNGDGAASNVFGPLPVFSMVPPPDAPARFAFNALGTVVTLDATLRSDSDYGLTANIRNVSEGLAIQATILTLWGVPSDPVHDHERACPGEVAPQAGGNACPSGAPRQAFLRNPTSCTAPGVGLPTTISLDSWDHPGDFQARTIHSHLGPGYPADPADWGPEAGTDGCDRVPFDATLSARPAVGAKAGEPSGFSFDLSIPQSDDPGSIGESDIKKAVVTLPQGVRVSPSSADGLSACSSAQIALTSTADPTCPDASKIGSATIDTPLLDEQLTGGIYLATPFDNPFDSLIAVYLVARGPGVVIKLPGQTQMDPDTGQITATFDDNPQLPFSRLHLEFKAGARAPLSMPTRCGTYTTHAVLTGWSGRTVSSDSSFTLAENGAGLPCPAQFSPGWSAGTESSGAGTSSPFSLRLTRSDADQELRSLTMSWPEGLLGRIADAVLCSDAAANAGTCGDGSLLGHVTVGAGAGSSPFYITDGTVHITGPYKGAPFGASIVVHAKAGPFDLGNVVVRAALFVDKHDATVRVVSDPLPTILQGIPLNVRDIRITIDKPGFMLNPTSCAEKAIGASVGSTAGATADLSTRFQAFDCGSLAFKPKMVVRVGGQGHTKRNRSTPLSTKIVMPNGQANLRFVRVTLPKTINARLTVINDACTRAEFESDIAKCDHARAGTATAVTPVLRDPLRGSVYFVKNGNPLPDLFVALRGQVDFDLIGRVTIPGSKYLRTTFATAPDVPIRSFALRLFGDAKNGSVGAAANLCSKTSRRQKVKLDFIGQNGKVSQLDRRLRVGGCKHHKAAKHRRKRSRR